MWEYTDKVKELFLNPKNVGEIENPDAIGEVGSIICGDALRLTLRIDKDNEKIIDAKFKTFGCASAIASSSALTELIKGKTIDEALKITNEDIVEYLGGLPKEKMHCSVMGREALEAAIANYKGISYTKKEEGRLICECFNITEEKIKKVAIENNLFTVDEVTNYTKAGGGCGECRDSIKSILDEIWSIKTNEIHKKQKRLANIQKIGLIQQIIEKEIKPNIKSDGGEIKLIDIEGNKVLINLKGKCTECIISDLTIDGIQKKLRELVSEDIIVEVE